MNQKRVEPHWHLLLSEADRQKCIDVADAMHRLHIDQPKHLFGRKPVQADPWIELCVFHQYPHDVGEDLPAFLAENGLLDMEAGQVIVTQKGDQSYLSMTTKGYFILLANEMVRKHKLTSRLKHQGYGLSIFGIPVCVFEASDFTYLDLQRSLLLLEQNMAKAKALLDGHPSKSTSGAFASVLMHTLVEMKDEQELSSDDGRTRYYGYCAGAPVMDHLKQMVDKQYQPDPKPEKERDYLESVDLSELGLSPEEQDGVRELLAAMMNPDKESRRKAGNPVNRAMASIGFGKIVRELDLYAELMPLDTHINRLFEARVAMADALSAYVSVLIDAPDIPKHDFIPDEVSERYRNEVTRLREQLKPAVIAIQDGTMDHLKGMVNVVGDAVEAIAEVNPNVVNDEESRS